MVYETAGEVGWLAQDSLIFCASLSLQLTSCYVVF